MPLNINGTLVKKISGPVSMYILTPKPNNDFPNLPLYILFGDKHHSNEKMCKQTKAEGVYEIYDIEFLSLLNSLTTPEEPIDFYVEGGEIHNSYRNSPYSEKYPMEMVWNLYFECYKHNGKKLVKYEHKTPCDKIENIRWQSADSRFF